MGDALCFGLHCAPGPKFALGKAVIQGGQGRSIFGWATGATCFTSCYNICRDTPFLEWNPLLWQVLVSAMVRRVSMPLGFGARRQQIREE